MVLFSPEDIKTKKLIADPCKVVRTCNKKFVFIGKPHDILKKHIGDIVSGETIQFWSWGRWSMHDLLFYILNQTGPADVLISTWSLCESAMRKILLQYKNKLIKSATFLIDPRVKVRNPVPLQLVIQNFTYKLIPCHAKVTLIWNDLWNISIISSMNMTENPRMERGIIFTDKETFEFDKKIITDEIYGPATEGN
jgi:hypothetical protein